MCLKIEEEKQMSKISYSNTIGSLMYAMICAWPDIAYVAELVNKF